MYKKYYFHIQLTKDSNWIKEIGTSITNVMANIANYNDIPYSYFKSEY